ncbi:DeoR/GlpR family transcriptional regulator of sugar metabolism [Neorhizobium galegae]|uniref:DeoR/GlpR family DNA-binding transcription regulator n=1 Tax=Neorhizobium galegae TaxID=399 RepID=UPI001AE937F3|nr:DeoR/GlpR family DNA-binding transcription regulator [Neorhizobium galegae]MBP2551109.1 DeoR/GlpR family transcriptional regulator of sugar metabolism [Neorhizobium galegae]
MFPAQRRARIIEHLRLQDAATVRDLSERIGISLSTVRRDIDYLCETGHLERTHGGAMLKPTMRAGFEPAQDIAEAMASEQKRAIGRHAATLITPGQSVIFDSGSTTAAAAAAAGERDTPFYAATNDLRIGLILGQRPHIGVSVASGQVRPGSATLYGAGAADFFSRLHADIAFIGVHGIFDTVLTDTTPEIADLKRLVLPAADRIVLLADSSKFELRAFCAFGRMADIDLVITDSGLSDVHRASIESAGATVEIANA